MKLHCPWLAVVLLGLVGSPAWAGDDTQFTLVVDREFRTIVGRIGDQKIYVNGKYVGAVSNDTRLRFAIPINATGKYALNVRSAASWMTGGDNANFAAKAGDEVLVKTGVTYEAWVDAVKIWSVHVYPSRAADLNVVPPAGGVALTVNGRTEQVATPRTIKTTEMATENRYLRLKCTAQGVSNQGDFIVFARPGSVSLLDFSNVNSQSDGSLIASIQFLLQLRGCVAFHLGHDLTDLAVSLGDLEKDLQVIRSEGVGAGALQLRDKQVAYFHKLKELSEKSPIAEPAVGLLCSALQCAGEALLTGSAPSKSDMLFSSAWAMLKAGYNKYQINADWSAADAEFGQAEEEVTSALKKEANERIALRKNPLIRQWIGGEDFIGKWAFTFQPKQGRTYSCCYSLESDGTLKELSAKDDSIKEGKATYTTDGSSIVIHWDGGNVETGVLDVIDPDHLKYEITDHSGDPTQVGMKFDLARISPNPKTNAALGVATATMSNSSGLRLEFQERWALGDGTWTSWSTTTLDPDSTSERTSGGAFGYEILIDQSLEKGEQNMRYSVPIQISFGRSSLSGVGGCKYRFALAGGKVVLNYDGTR